MKTEGIHEVARGAGARDRGTAAAQTGDDPFQWLEDVQGEKALAWVREHNAKSTALLEARKEYKPIYARTLEILDSKEKIPTPELLGETVYNFWKDDAHERGIWRRTSLASYRTASPEWETVLDVDALAKADGKAWVWHDADCLPPANARCMVALSPGGSDASVVREFDTASKQFVAGGFSLPEAKSRVSWRDEDTLWVGTDFGPGTLTASGYPRLVKLWKRGTPLSEAKTVFECKAGGRLRERQHRDPERRAVRRRHAHARVLQARGVPLPRRPPREDRHARGRAAARVLPRPAPHLAAQRLDDRRQDVSRGLAPRRLRRRRAPRRPPLRRALRAGERVSLGRVERTKDRVLIQTLDNVRSRITALALEDGAWKRSEVALPGLGTAAFAATSDLTNAYFFTYQDYSSPTSLWLAGTSEPAKVKSMPAFFDATGVKTEQFEAVSKDGTKIPYFVVTPKGFKADGTAPTLLYGYGGFEQSEVPRYSGTIGAAWLARGGVFVDANLRGGGEFGPEWHKAAVKEKHIHNFEDFSAVASDLIARKITSARHLGIMGGSQGGLLVGGTFTLYPDLFHAVVAQVPLADMRRYNKLLAGASWMAEYGDPDKPEDWAYIKTWSPYELLKKDAKYPTPFYWTNTRDDRVHPGHARKMVAKMESLGHPVYYFENTEGGHGSGAVNKQTAQVTALQYAYLWMMLR